MAYPHIRISGTARERGRRYGEAARNRILVSKAGYQEVFQARAGLTWSAAVAASKVYEEPIREAFPSYLEEMQGIAEGSGLTLGDVLVLNARTEIIGAAIVGNQARQGAECSSFALLGSRTECGHTLLGQNWDWLVHSFGSLVVLEVEQDERPNFVTVVEAGLLAKTGMNSSGLGVTPNAMLTAADRGIAGLPFHVILRALMDCDTITDAINVVQRYERASSANYLLAHADGLAIDLETAPGGYCETQPILPVNSALVHTNHFLKPPFGTHDMAVCTMPDSLTRLRRIHASIAGCGKRLSVGSLRDALSDHVGFPNSVCCHPDPHEAGGEQWATVMSIVMDLNARVVRLSDGNPCLHEYRELQVDTLLGKSSPQPGQRPATMSPPFG
jgi:isopenicillin-N N-acyltransferase like protein